MQTTRDTGPEDRAKARLGLIMFGVYALVYAGFVLINTIAPKLMGAIVFSGLTLAVVYGMGLIIFAILLGLIYSRAASRLEDRAEAAAGSASAKGTAE